MSAVLGHDVAGEVAFLSRELKTPVINDTFAVLGDQARAEGWSHEEYLAAVLGRQVASRTANGTRMPIAAAHFPPVKTIEDFSFDHVPGTVRDVIAHLATTTFIAKRENVVLLGPPGTGKTHLGIALAIKAAEASYPVAFDSATRWLERLAAAHAQGHLERELRKLNRYRLLVIDEVGYLPFDAAAASLFFQLIASRYETGSVIVTSNLVFSRWGEPSATTSSPRPRSTVSSTTRKSSPWTASPTEPAHRPPPAAARTN